MAESDIERVKDLEVKMSQIYLQKEQLLNLIERLRDAMPSNNLQRIFTDIIETVHESFKIEEDQ